MASLRSWALWFVIKYILSKQAAGLSLQEERRYLDDLGKKEKIAPGIKVERIAIDGLAAEELTPSDARGNKVILYLHGGYYNLGSCDSHRSLASMIARSAGMRLVLLEYRLAPEHPFPAAIDDAAKAYRWLLEKGNLPGDIAIVGDSAGAGLAVASTVYLRDQKVGLPGAVVCLSPWVDLEHTGDSIVTQAGREAVLTLEELRKFAGQYAPKHNYCNPLISPIYADLSGLPPLLIQVGEWEMLHSDAVRLAEKAHEDGVAVTLEVGKRMWHVWQYFANHLPEARRAIDEIAGFLRQHLAE